MNKIVPIEPAIAIPNDITEEQKLSIQFILESDHIIVSKAEYEQMQKDAERYRWLTCRPYFIADTKIHVHEYSPPETIAQLDEAIDKAKDNP
jgi:hypothetical protein